MNIEKLREEAAKLPPGTQPPYSNYRSYDVGFHAGADWEYSRPKWVNVEDGLPPAGKTGRTSERVLVEYTDGTFEVTRYDHYTESFRLHTNRIENRWTEIPKC